MNDREPFWASWGGKQNHWTYNKRNGRWETPCGKFMTVKPLALKAETPCIGCGAQP